MWFIIFSIISCIFGIKTDVPIDADYIECYWCNSRDMYCGKRVIDTMVSTVKCPKQSKCVVYTNPYDNYFLHRGCTYGMDLGEMVIKNGCYVEEEGATYCFCDFNRCNAAGILDLRNLVGDNQDTRDKLKKINSNSTSSLWNNHHNTLTNYRKHPEKSPALSSYPNNIKFSGVTSFDHLTRNFKKLLAQYLSHGNYKNGIKADKFKEHLNKIVQKDSKSQKDLNINQNITENYKNLISTHRPTRPKIHPIFTSNQSTKPILPIELLKKINKLSTKFSTKRMPTKMPIYTTTPVNLPLLYKLKINDSLSKSLLDDQSIRQKLGIKPNEHLNIVVKKPLNTDFKSEFEVTSVPDETKTDFVQEIKPTEKSTSKFAVSKTTLSWLSKLKAKLDEVLSSTQLPQYVNNLRTIDNVIPIKTTNTVTSTKKTTSTSAPTTHSENDWTHVLSDKYKQNLENAKFKCPKNGLFSHPINCSQFIQCVDFGTYYERFYILNCPNALHFNEKLGLCDYLNNVDCREKRKF